MPLPLLSELLAGAFAVFASRQFEGRQAPQTREAENGDVIKVNRGAYDHYGVYVQGRRVIHYTGATGPADFNGRVRETSLEEFLNGADGFTVCHFPANLDDYSRMKERACSQMKPGACSRMKQGACSQRLKPVKSGSAPSLLRMLWQEIRASKLKDYHLYSGEETVARARGELGREGYNLIFNNCEHFAVWCKTGIKDSSQVNRFLDILVALHDA